MRCSECVSVRCLPDTQPPPCSGGRYQRWMGTNVSYLEAGRRTKGGAEQRQRFEPVLLSLGSLEGSA
ncbi:hypothetical protein E2C01_052561 [Portunus trituberculatus]|uniref:Uncharacterized protein n=1 Tax=Portunus trituberculatus TaxID=210409 RepID=A0A5B7GM73_PORTR|nr:hypothetical protein [Portunus trituberculatus]